MSRRPAPLAPRKVSINGLIRWEVRVPAELQAQENSARPRFIKESEAKGYCNRLKSDLLRYSDKARGLTDAQKIEAHACFERLATYPAATLTHAVDLLVARLDRSTRSFPVSELAGRVVADKVKEGGRGSSARMLREIDERMGRFSRVFGDRTVSDIEAVEVRAWLMDLTTIIQTSRGKEETDQPVKQSTRHAYRRVLSLCFAWAKRHGAAADNPIADVKLAAPKKERVFVFTPEQTTILLQSADENLQPYLALCAFAGLRPEQAQGLWWNQIHFDRGTHGEIEVPEGTDKASGERIVPIQPNLRAWLLAVAKGRGKNKRPQRRLINGAMYEVARFLKNGDLVLNNGWVLPRSYGHLAHGYCTTSHASQGMTADTVLISQSAESFRASSSEQFYVSSSRGRTGIKIYTDSVDDLFRAVCRSSQQISAADLMLSTSGPTSLSDVLRSKRQRFAEAHRQRGGQTAVGVSRRRSHLSMAMDRRVPVIAAVDHTRLETGAPRGVPVITTEDPTRRKISARHAGEWVCASPIFQLALSPDSLAKINTKPAEPITSAVMLAMPPKEKTSFVPMFHPEPETHPHRPSQ